MGKKDDICVFVMLCITGILSIVRCGHIIVSEGFVQLINHEFPLYGLLLTIGAVFAYVYTTRLYPKLDEFKSMMSAAMLSSLGVILLTYMLIDICILSVSTVFDELSSLWEGIDVIITIPLTMMAICALLALLFETFYRLQYLNKFIFKSLFSVFRREDS